MTKNPLIAAKLKDYYIESEDKNGKARKQKCSGDIYVGYFTKVGSDCYFYGAFFAREKNGYHIVGTVHMTQEKFFASVETWTEIF